MSDAPWIIPVLIDERMPVKHLTQLAAELKTRILEKVEPGQDWAAFSIHLGARGRWCFAFDAKFAASGTERPSARRSGNSRRG